MHEGEKKPPVGGLLEAGEAWVLWRVRKVPGDAPGATLLSIRADSREARELLGELDVHGHKPAQVVDRDRTVERDAETGAYYTTGVALLLNH